jgi:hypothetical protein
VVNDPIRERRARIARQVAIGKRVGYTLLLVGIVMFFVSLIAGFPAWAVVTTIVALVASFVILPIPIVLGYGVRAAEREDPGPRS